MSPRRLARAPRRRRTHARGDARRQVSWPLLARSVAVGVGATAFMDTCAELVRRTTGVEPLDYRLVGRWIGHMRDGAFCHEDIRAVEPLAYERELGWVAHYSIGTGFASALVIARPGWVVAPTVLPAIVTGLASTAAPWLIMQPAFGMGVAAARTPNPPVARWRGLRTHAIYGAGIYLTAEILSMALDRGAKRGGAPAAVRRDRAARRAR